MMTRDIQIGIVGHYTRQDQIKQLAKEVKADSVCLDEGGVGCEENHLRAWRSLAWIGAEWCVVLEDDAVPVSELREELAKMLPHAPTPVVSLYLGRKRPPQYQDSVAQVIGLDSPFIMTDLYTHGVGICVKWNFVSSLIAYLELRKRRVEEDLEEQLPIDELIAEWVQGKGLEITFTNPSLVNHADGPTVLDFHPSRSKEEDMSTREPGRVAWRFGTRESWEGDSIRLPAPGTWYESPVNK